MGGAIRPTAVTLTNAAAVNFTGAASSSASHARKYWKRTLASSVTSLGEERDVVVRAV